MQCLSPSTIKLADGCQRLVPCNHCLNCGIARQLGWTIRICLEAQERISNSFLTLTYEEKSRPGYLEYRDVQLFMKRLRKDTPTTVRFFCVGQHGTRHGREHWHLILFGVNSAELSAKLNGKSLLIPGRGPQHLVQQPTELWPGGSMHIAELNVHRARYAARYSLRSSLSDKSKDVVNMSRRPGIGLDRIRQIGAWMGSQRAYWEQLPGWWKLGTSYYPLDKTARAALKQAFEAAGGTVGGVKSNLVFHSEARLTALCGDILAPGKNSRFPDYMRFERRELNRGSF